MYNVTQLFKNNAKTQNREVEMKILIDGIEYDKSKIIELDIENSISSGEKFSLGNIISSRLNFSIREFDLTAPENALVEPCIRFSNSEWIPLGKYYIDNRRFTNQRFWAFECYDKSMFLNQDYISNLLYPQTMRNVLTEVCYQIELEIENIEVINSTYQIYLLPTDITLHQMVSYIASANGCSVVINRDGKLKFIKFTPSMYNNPVETLTMKDYIKATRTNEIKVFDTIKLYEKDGFTEGEFSELVRGSGDENSTLNIVNPFINENILDDLYSSFNGFQYIPYELDYRCFPYLEVGDVLTLEQSKGTSWLETTETWGSADFPWDFDVVNFNIIILHEKIVYKGGLRSTLKAESESIQSSEFKFKGSLRKHIEKVDKNSIKEGKIYNGVTTSREHGVVVERTDGKAKAIMNATEGYSLWSDTGTGLEKKFYVDLDGKVQAKGLVIDGTSEFNGTIKANQIVIGGDNGNISFDDLSDKPNITQITKDTVTTSYINALDVTAKDVEADWVYAGNIKVNQLLMGGDNGVIKWVDIDSKPTDLVTDSKLKTELGKDYIITGKIKANQLVIGGDNGTISFDDLSNKPSIPTTSQITQITKDTITTTYINALDITANSVKSTWVYAGTLTAAQIVATGVKVGTGGIQLDSTATISWGNVTSKPTILTSTDVTTITNNTISTTNILAQNLRVKSANIDGTITADTVKSTWVYTGNIIASQISSGSISADRISGGTLQGVTVDVSTNVKVGQNISMISGNNYINFNAGGSFNGSSGGYIHYSSTNNMTIKSSGSITINPGSTLSITPSGNATITTAYNRILTLDSYDLKLGNTSTSAYVTIRGNCYLPSRIGFFDATSTSTKTSVTTVSTSTTDIPTIRNKLNELINALRGYNLV